MIMKFYVYELIDPRTGTPFYVGKGTGKRGHSHLKWESIRGINPFKDAVIDKIRLVGAEPIVNVVYRTNDENAAFMEECRLITLYGRRDKSRITGVLTNLTNGGEGQSGRIVPDELKAHYSKIYSGEGTPFFGKAHTSETLRLIAENRVYLVSDEQKSKIRVSLIGRPKSVEWRRNISEGLRGKVKSPEHVEKNSCF